MTIDGTEVKRYEVETFVRIVSYSMDGFPVYEKAPENDAVGKQMTFKPNRNDPIGKQAKRGEESCMF